MDEELGGLETTVVLKADNGASVDWLGAGNSPATLDADSDNEGEVDVKC